MRGRPGARTRPARAQPRGPMRAPRREGPFGPLRDEREHERGGGGKSSEREVRRATGGKRARKRALELELRRRDLGDSIAGKRVVVGPDVAPAPPVRDGRAAAHVRLEDGEAARRVNEGVPGREPVAHPVGEPFDADARLVPEPALEPAAQLLVAAAEADDLADAV